MEVRCPSCNRFLAEMTPVPGTAVRGYCRECSLRFEEKAVDKRRPAKARSR